MTHIVESVLNCVGLFVGPLLGVGAMGVGLAMLQRMVDSLHQQPLRPLQVSPRWHFSADRSR